MAIFKFKVTRYDNQAEEVAASSYSYDKDNQWIHFQDGSGIVKSLRAEDVRRIDRQ